MSINVRGDEFFITSDIHFFHNNIIKYCDRPWDNADEMNEGLIRNWNQAVKPTDTVFIVGDVAMGGRSKGPILAKILSRLNGKLMLVPGNHDTYILNSEECLEHITVLPPLVEVRVSDPKAPKGRQRIVLCHYAMKVWNKSHHGTWHLYGHSHHTMPPDYDVKAFDVGIDGKGYDYRPLSYDQVANLMSSHGQKTVDHHNSNTN